MENFREIISILVRIEEFNSDLEKELKWKRPVTIILAIVFWIIGFALSFSGHREAALFFYLLGICFGTWSITGETKYVIRDFRNPVKQNLPSLYSYQILREEIRNSLTKFSCDDLSYALDILKERHASMNRNMSWFIGPVEKAGFFSILFSVAYGVYEFYRSSNSLWISFVVSGLIFGFLLGTLTIRSVINWHLWSIRTLENYIEPQKYNEKVSKRLGNSGQIRN